MKSALDEEFDAADVVVMTAAVADYRPRSAAEHKLRKTSGLDGEGLALERTDDILAGLGAAAKTQVLVGFAMETQDLVASAQRKLHAKGLHLVVANHLGTPGAGFAGATNVVTLVTREGAKPLPLMSKEKVADQLLDTILPMLGDVTREDIP